MFGLMAKRDQLRRWQQGLELREQALAERERRVQAAVTYNQLDARLSSFDRKLDLLIKRNEEVWRHMQDLLDGILSEARKTKTLADSVRVLLQQMNQKLAQAPNIEVARQGFQQLVEANQEITSALVENTPAQNVDPNAPGAAPGT